MAIILNTEFCWPLAAVGPNNAVVELFEHARRGVLGDNVSNPAKLPDEASRSHTPAVRQLQVLDATARWLSSIVASDAGRLARSCRRLSREGQSREQCPRRTLS